MVGQSIFRPISSRVKIEETKERLKGNQRQREGLATICMHVPFPSPTLSLRLFPATRPLTVPLAH